MERVVGRASERAGERTRAMNCVGTSATRRKVARHQRGKINQKFASADARDRFASTVHFQIFAPSFYYIYSGDSFSLAREVVRFYLRIAQAQVTLLDCFASSAAPRLITRREATIDQRGRNVERRRHDNRENNCQQKRRNDRGCFKGPGGCALYLSWLPDVVESCIRVACFFLPWRTAGLPVTARYEDFRGKLTGLHRRFAVAKGSLSHVDPRALDQS